MSIKLSDENCLLNNNHIKLLYTYTEILLCYPATNCLYSR